MAITQEQLKQAVLTLNEMERIIGRLRLYINTAQSGRAGIVDLTADQKQGLIDKYSAEKGQLPIKYQELP